MDMTSVLEMTLSMLGLSSLAIGSGVVIALVVMVVIGVICGLAPLICGILEKKVGLGIGGMCACIVLSVFGLWIPTAVFFLFLIYKDKIFKSKDANKNSEVAVQEEQETK